MKGMRAFLFALSMLLNLPLMADVECVYADYRRMTEEEKRRDFSEDDLIESEISLSLRENYEVVADTLVGLILSKNIRARDLELVWWRAKNPDIRLFVLIAYFKRYGCKGVSPFAVFEELTDDFSEENKRIRLNEIAEVYKILHLTPPQKK